MARKPPGSYDVGYGKPPEHSRFQEGRSGNPKGRPKGAKNLTTLIDEEWNRPITVKENGKARKLTQGTVVIKRAIQQAMNGDPRAREFFLRFASMQQGKPDPATTLPDTPAALLTPGEDEILQELLERFADPGRSEDDGDA